jgi:hypothetical protein
MIVAVFTWIILLVYLCIYVVIYTIICLTQNTINLWQRWIDILIRASWFNYQHSGVTIGLFILILILILIVSAFFTLLHVMRI